METLVITSERYYLLPSPNHFQLEIQQLLDDKTETEVLLQKGKDEQERMSQEVLILSTENGLYKVTFMFVAVSFCNMRDFNRARSKQSHNAIFHWNAQKYSVKIL